MNAELATLRAELATIQRHPAHARIGEELHRYVDDKGKLHVVRRSTFEVCPACPVRRECKRASLALAAAETLVISGG